jgi:hypothetical protein
MTQAALRSVQDILLAAAGEASELVGLAEDLQLAIVGLGAGMAGARPEVLMGCQAADMLSQRLSGMVLYLNCLAAAAPEGVVIDTGAAARALPLAEQAAALGGRARRVDPEPDPNGELELFDVHA